MKQIVASLKYTPLLYLIVNINTFTVHLTVKLELKFMLRCRTAKKTNLMIVDILKLYETDVETDYS